MNAIVHLAVLSNDPLGEIDPELTFDINYKATMRLADMAHNAGVGRFVYSGSCSVYGASAESDDTPLDESAPLDPKTPYADSKVRAERELLELSSDSFAVVSLRNATAFGISPSQRFDVVLPNLAGTAWTIGEICLRSDGSPWRPIVHVRDISRAICSVLNAESDRIAGRVFNVGRNENNHQIHEIADAVHRRLGNEAPVRYADDAGPDERTYKVDFSRIHRALDDFEARWSLSDGVHECRLVFSHIDLDTHMFDQPHFTRLARIRELMDSGQLDERLRWRSAPTAAA